MSDVFVASLISASAIIIVAFLSFSLNKKMELDAAWRQQKLEYYKEFVDALAMNVEGDDTAETHREFARASNNLLLIAPKSVLLSHHKFREHISLRNRNRDVEKDGELLATLLKAMRDDLGMPSARELDPSLVKLWTSGQGRLFSKRGD